MRDFLKQLFSSDADSETVTPVDAKNAIRKVVTVTGRVQGVGFRYFVRQEARALNVSGWVKNLNDGSVMMEIQAPRSVLDNLIERLNKGNGFSKIVQLKENEVPVVEGENKFGIKY